MIAGGRVRLTTSRSGPSGRGGSTGAGRVARTRSRAGSATAPISATPSIDQRDVDRPVVAVLLAELPGAVERVDDPDPGRVEPIAVVRGLLGEDRVVRPGSPQRVEDEDVRRGVAVGAPRRRIVAGGAQRQQQPPGVVGDPGGELVVVGHRRCRASGSAIIFSIFVGSLPDGEVGERHVLEDRAQARARAAIHTSTTAAPARGSEVLGRLTAHGTERDRRPRGSRLRR